jgi:hypothetical protein
MKPKGLNPGIYAQNPGDPGSAPAGDRTTVHAGTSQFVPSVPLLPAGVPEADRETNPP